MKRILLALALLWAIPALSQTATRATLSTGVNAQITSNGKGAITGPVLNSLLNLFISNMGVLGDASNPFIGAFTISGSAGGLPPANTIGAAGNYFYDTDSGNVWGPNVAGVWPVTPAFAGAGGPSAFSVTTPFNASGINATSSTTLPQFLGSYVDPNLSFGTLGDGVTNSMLVTCVSGTKNVTFARNGSNNTPNFSAADIGKTVDLPGCSNVYTATGNGTLTAAGSSYGLGNTITLAVGGGTATTAAVVTVSGAGLSSSVLTYAVTNPGSYSVAPSGVQAQASTSGGGSGAQFTLTYQSRLLATITAVTDSSHIVISTNATASITAIAQNVTWGHDDTVGLQAAVNTCRFVRLTDSKTYLTTGIVLPNCQPSTFNQIAGITSLNGSTIRALPGATYTAATTNWVNNQTFSSFGYFLSGITLDAGNTALYAYVDQTFASVYQNSHFINAIDHGLYETGLTANGSQLANGRNQIVLENSDAFGNGADGIHADNASFVTHAPVDVQIQGGFFHDNKGTGIFASTSAGWQISGTHDYSNSAFDLFLGSYGFGGGVSENYFEDSINVEEINSTSHQGVIGPGNKIGGSISSYFLDNTTGSSLTSQGNQFYTCAVSLVNQFNANSHPIISNGDTFACPIFQWVGNAASNAQVVLQNANTFSGGTSTNASYCTTNGLIQPTSAGQTIACTDFDIFKTASATNTTIVFTIVGTVPNVVATPGAGFDIQGSLEVTSYFAGPTFETYQSDLRASYAHAVSTTNVVHKGSLINVVDSSGSPAVSAAVVCVDTTISASANNVETCTITATFTAALDSANTRARLRLHSDSRQVISMTVQ